MLIADTMQASCGATYETCLQLLPLASMQLQAAGSPDSSSPNEDCTAPTLPCLSCTGAEPAANAAQAVETLERPDASSGTSWDDVDEPLPVSLALDCSLVLYTTQRSRTMLVMPACNRKNALLVIVVTMVHTTSVVGKLGELGQGMQGLCLLAESGQVA